MAYMQTQGPKLIRNGYLVIPVKLGKKSPAIKEWQNARLSLEDLQKYNGEYGIGVLCGQGAHPIAAIDVDTTNTALAKRFTRWCRDRLGAACERVGMPPKTLLVYRASESGWSKATSKSFRDKYGKQHRLEILGNGQQFVAYNTHPETGQPYKWVDQFGGIESVQARYLPTIAKDQVNEALRVFELMALEEGLEAVSGSNRTVAGNGTSDEGEDETNPLMTYEPPVGLSIEDAKRLIVNLDNEDYETWLKVGMALHHEFGGSAAALMLWDEWSSTASNYIGRSDIEYRWDSFKDNKESLVTARWLIAESRRREQELHKEIKRSELDEVKALIAKCDDSMELLDSVAKRAGVVADGNTALQAELIGLIRSRFRALTGQNIPAADVRAAMLHKHKAITVKRALTEFGNADRMLDRYGDDLMYVPELAQYYIWTGKYWRKVEQVEVEHLAKETIRSLMDEAKTIGDDRERADFLKFCIASQKASMVRNIVTLAQSDPKVVVNAEALDRNTNLLGVSNGVVDLTTGELLPPDRKYRVTVITNVEYDKDAKAPLFEQTISDVFFGDEEMISFFRRLVGYSLLGKPTENIIAIPYGLGANGKSTVLGAIRDVLGKHARTASADTFLTTGSSGRSAGAAREDVLRLRGARFVYVSEPDEGSELKEGLIKSMTGGEPIPARGLYAKTTIEITPTWVVFMPTNHKPIIKGDDYAIWRRIMLIPFTRDFDHDLVIKKDRQRGEKLIAEAKGILAWCVKGALEYQQKGLCPPASVMEAVDEYRSDMDLLRDWIDECCELGVGYVETTARLWASWEQYARSRGELRYIQSAKALGKRLSSRGFKAVRNVGEARARGFAGIRVARGLGADF